jgi:hypothetical protein
MGHVYQGRFKSFPIAADEHLLSVLRYVEPNPLREELVSRAETWRWGSLYRRTRGTTEERALLTESPVPLRRLWTQRVNPAADRSRAGRRSPLRHSRSAVRQRRLAEEGGPATRAGAHVPFPRPPPQAPARQHGGRCPHMTPVRFVFAPMVPITYTLIVIPRSRPEGANCGAFGRLLRGDPKWQSRPWSSLDSLKSFAKEWRSRQPRSPTFWSHRSYFLEVTNRAPSTATDI